MKRSYTYLKGLLTLALAAFTGWMWAADPVATWTDFNTLTSGNYTITKDAACAVNADGSITLGGAGLELSFSAGQPAYDNNSITVVMDVSNVPSDAKLVDVTTGGQSDNLYYDGSKLYQRAGTTANYGNCAWTAERATIAFAYGAGGDNTTGTTTYIDGVQSIDANNLKWTGDRHVTKVAFPATGMTIHSIRLYGTKISAEEVYAATYRSVISYCVNNTTSNDELSGLAIGEDAVARVKNKHWNNISCPNGGQNETANSYSLNSAQDNNGRVWPIGVSGTAGGQWWHDQTGSLGAKGNNYADGPWVMNFKDIPFTKYDVVLYMATDTGDQKWGAIQVGETNSTYYVPDSTDPTVATSTDVTASTQWGQSTPATAAYGTNVIRITDLTDEDLYLKTLKNTRGGLHGFQIINRGEIRKIKADAGTTVTYTADTEIAVEVSGTGTLSANGCTLDVTKATMKGCALAAQNKGVIVLKADQLDTIGGLTIPQGATVKIVTDSTDAVIIGKAVFAVPANTTIAGTVTLVTLDGEKEAAAEIAEGILTAKFTANPSTTGTAWWWDYEFTGNATSIGSDKGGMTLEKTEWTQYTEADDEGNQALYFQQTPWRDAAFISQDAFTAVMYCQPGNYNNVPLVGFGSTTAAGKVAVVLATGANAAGGEMSILLVRGDNHAVTSLADNLIVPNATTTNHLYAFTFDAQVDKTVISVYVDGKLKKTTTVNERFHVSNGFQIGSIHGGVMKDQTGLKKYTDGATEELEGTIDFLRVAKGVLSVDAMKALAKEYPYVSENGIAQRTIVDATATWVADAAWTQKSAGADVQQDAPNAGTNVALTIDAETEVTVNLDSDTTYETMTIDGTEAVTFKKGESKILAGDLTISTDTAIEYGAIEVGTVAIDAGKTLTFDFSAYDFASVWADRTISLTGLATVADGAEVTATIPETLPAQIQSATFTYNGETQEYALVIDFVEGELTGTIATDGNWDSITWKMGEADVVAPTDFTFVTKVNLIASADATLSMNKAITVTNLTISGEGALIIAENGGNKLTVSGATTIDANVTATAGAAALGSISITDGNSLAIKEKIANVGTIASNAGELVYMGDNITITEDKQLTNVIGKIRITSGTVNFTQANGDYTSGAITIDNGATMKTTSQHSAPFGNSPIENNGAIVVASTGSPWINTVVSGAGTLTVESGTLTLQGANTYKGATTIAAGAKVVAQTANGATWSFNNVSSEPDITVNGELELVSSTDIYRGIAGAGTVRVSGDILLGNTGNAGELSGLSRFTGTLIVAAEKTLTLRTWGNQYDVVLTALEVNGTVKGETKGGNGKPVVIKTSTLSGSGTIENTLTLADGATLAGAVTVTGDVTVEGALTITHATVAGDTVITCANAEAVAAALTGAPEGLRYVAEDGAVKLAVAKKTNFVVTVGEETVNCETVAEALDALAANGGSLQIAADADPEALALTETLTIAANTTINFNGKTLTSTADPAIHVTGGTLTLTGEEGSITAPGVVIQQGTKSAGLTTKVIVGEGVLLTSFRTEGEDYDGDNVVLLYGKATLESAGVLLTYSKGYAAIQGSGGDAGAETAITITGGQVVNNGDVAIYQPQAGTLTITGGVISGSTAIYAKAGTITISGGEISGTGAQNAYGENHNGCGSTGDALVVDTTAGYATPTVSITGGTFTSDNAAAVASYAGAGQTAATGIVKADATATFSSDVSDLCEAGYKTEAVAEGVYGVVEDPAYGKVAKVGDTYYATLAEAIENATAGQTITLLAGVTINSRLDIAQNVTIDLNGQTIAETMEDQFGAIYVKKGATLTIAATNGGEITTDGGIVIGNYGTVIVDGGTIAAGEDAETDVSIYNFYYQADWYGTTTINGGTVARIWNCGVATLADGEVTDVDNSGAMTITDATVTNIILRDGTDAPGIEGAGTLTAPEGLTVTTLDGQKAVYADGKYTVVKILTLPEELVDSPAAEAIEAAMEAAGVTEISSYTITTKGTADEAATVAAVADVLEVFDVTPTVDANGVLTVTYEFGISKMTKSGDTITITAGVTGAEYREGVTVGFYADGEEVIGTATTGADSTEVSIMADAANLNGKKITVKATK